MPNWCSNDLTICGKKKDLLAFKKKARGTGKFEDGSVRELDFNKFVPYPKKYAKLDASYEKRTEIHQKKLFEAFPNTIDREGKRWREFIDKNPYPKDGYNSGGYDWCVANWGTKWNACEVYVESSDGELLYAFNTAWAPPREVIREMSKQHPELIFNLVYEEPGMCFRGEDEFVAGEMSQINYEEDYSQNEEEEEEQVAIR